MFSSKGELIEKRKVSDSVASAVINDENAFYNAYVSTVNKYFNELFSKQLKSLEYYVLSNTAHQLSFEKLSDAVDLVSTGSGFVINSSGNIVTNYHVVKECLAITTNENGIKKNAKLIASDSKNDIAILSTEVESKNHAYFPSKIHAGRLGDEIITLARMFHPAFDSMLFNPY
ncbi:MAG: trypsin-like peptidase domain-containing protein [Candidatus Sedimenticola sp. (ex Thyasira tokunagai)]